MNIDKYGFYLRLIRCCSKAFVSFPSLVNLGGGNFDLESLHQRLFEGAFWRQQTFRTHENLISGYVDLRRCDQCWFLWQTLTWDDSKPCFALLHWVSTSVSKLQTGNYKFWRKTKHMKSNQLLSSEVSHDIVLQYWIKFKFTPSDLIFPV